VQGREICHVLAKLADARPVECADVLKEQSNFYKGGGQRVCEGADVDVLGKISVMA